MSKSERLAHIRIVQAGVVRLERVLDKTGADFRIKRSEVVVVECPSVGFEPVVDDFKKGKRCVGDTEEASVRARGVAPLELRWSVDVSPKPPTTLAHQNFAIRGIEGKEEVCLIFICVLSLLI